MQRECYQFYFIYFVLNVAVSVDTMPIKHFLKQIKTVSFWLFSTKKVSGLFLYKQKAIACFHDRRVLKLIQKSDKGKNNCLCVRVPSHMSFLSSVFVSSSVISIPVSLVVFMEINGMHYFGSIRYIYTGCNSKNV